MSVRPPIFVITGPPGAGKTSLALALLARYPLGYHLHVDDLRTWMVQGLSDSVPWTDETERQFQIAEEAACDVALRYREGGAAVVFDHCRNLVRLNELLSRRIPEGLVRVCLLPRLETNLERNRTRQNKTFDPQILEETIRATHGAFKNAEHAGWLVIDNTDLEIDQTVEEVMEWVEALDRDVDSASEQPSNYASQ